jgi:hypothetical protein
MRLVETFLAKAGNVDVLYGFLVYLSGLFRATFLRLLLLDRLLIHYLGFDTCFHFIVDFTPKLKDRSNTAVLNFCIILAVCSNE